MRVVATAGHVDHGKSTLVRRLTGMEPDRWAEERRRGMTIDLGYAWTTLPSGVELAFVDVPGHQRFIGNMLAGLGPAAAVMFVVAADEGWRAQSEEHLAAVDALQLRDGLLVVTRSDLADPAEALEHARRRIASTSLGAVDTVAVSGATGAGLDALRAALDRLAARIPSPDPDADVRLWVDRSFTVRGSGTVVTATLDVGSVAVGDELELRGRAVGVRALQSLGAGRDRVVAPARVALNVRGVAREDVSRGDALLTPGVWHRTAVIDARVSVPDALPTHVTMHIGTAALPVRVRALGDGIVRITLPDAVPIRAGDRAVLRDPGQQQTRAGVVVLDADPPPLTRRGAAARRAADLAGATGVFDSTAEVARRGAMRRRQLRALGGAVPADGYEVGEWLVAPETWRRWVGSARPAALEWARRFPVDPDLPLAAFARELGLPDASLAAPVAAAAALPVQAGRITLPRDSSLGPAEDAVRCIEERLQAAPFDPPDANELAELRVTHRDLAAAERIGRLLRLTDQIVLLRSAPDEALRRLRDLPQPFTTSQARAALDTTRRVVIPLLEYLDAHGMTTRVDASLRTIRR